LRPDSLRFLVFFSSVAGSFGNRGQADYAAANEVLSKLAVSLDRRWPCRVVAIDWGPWETTGMASSGVEQILREGGMQLSAPAAGRRALALEIARGRKGDGEVVIGAGPWAVPRDGRSQAPASRELAAAPAGDSSSLDPATKG